MNKEQLINETLNSLKGIKKAQANPFLYEKVLNRMSAGNTTERRIFFSLRWQVVTLTLLLALNAFTLISNKKNEVKENASAFATEYFGKENSYNY